MPNWSVTIYLVHLLILCSTFLVVEVDGWHISNIYICMSKQCCNLNFHWCILEALGNCVSNLLASGGQFILKIFSVNQKKGKKHSLYHCFGLLITRDNESGFFSQLCLVFYIRVIIESLVSVKWGMRVHMLSIGFTPLWFIGCFLFTS